MNRVEHVTHAEHLALDSGYTKAELRKGEAAHFVIGVLSVTCEQADDKIDQLKQEIRDLNRAISQLEIECDSVRAAACEMGAKY